MKPVEWKEVNERGERVERRWLALGGLRGSVGCGCLRFVFLASLVWSVFSGWAAFDPSSTTARAQGIAASVVVSPQTDSPQTDVGRASNGDASGPVAAERNLPGPSARGMPRDEDMERLLDELDRRVAQGQWELAASLAQRVLEEGHHAVVWDQGTRRWLTAVQGVERRLAMFTDEGRNRYRLLVDDEAHALLGGPIATADARRLAEVSQRYLFSSVGGDVTSWCARRALEEGNFVSAARYCERWWQRGEGDPGERRQMALVAAVAYAYLDAPTHARRWATEGGPAMAKVKRQAATVENTGGVANKKADTVSGPGKQGGSEGGGEQGKKEREGRQATTEDEERVLGHVRRLLEEPGLAREWWSVNDARVRHASHAQCERTLRDTLGRTNVVWVGRALSAERGMVSRLPDLSDAARLAAVLRLGDAAVVGPGYDDVVPRADGAASGQRWRLAQVAPPPASAVASGHRLAWRAGETWNVFQFDAANWTPLWQATAIEAWRLPNLWESTSASRVLPRVIGRSSDGATEVDIVPLDASRWLDATRGVAWLTGESLFCTEGRGQPTPVSRRQWSPRARSNQIVCRDARDGRVRWRYPTSVHGDDETVAGAGASTGDRASTATKVDVEQTILGAIPGAGDMLYVSELLDATINMTALDARTGAVLWATPVAREVDSATDADAVTEPCVWTGVWAAADQGLVHVATGTGGLMSLDAVTGAPQWLHAYERNEDAREDDPIGRGPGEKFNGDVQAYEGSDGERGWSEQRVVCAGQWLLVVATDSATLLAFDRLGGGQLAWEIPGRMPDGERADRLVGVTDDLVVVAGPRVARAHRLDSGKLVWQTRMPRRAGDALLLDSLVVAPVHRDSREDSHRFVSVDRSPATLQPQLDLMLLDVKTGAVIDQRQLDTQLAPPLALHATEAGWVLSSFEGLEVLEVTSRQATNDGALESGRSDTRLRPLMRRAIAAGSGGSGPRPANVGAMSMLIGDLLTGRCWEFDERGQEIWTSSEVALPGPACVWRNGKRWILDHVSNEVVEWDERGSLAARWVGLPGRPASLSVNTTAMGEALQDCLMTFPDSGCVASVREDGEWQWSVLLAGRPVDARRDSQGRVWVALWDSQSIVMLDDARRVAHTLPLSARPRWLQWSGNDLLVTLPERAHVLRYAISPGPTPAVVGTETDTTRAGSANDSVARAGARGMRGAWRLPDGGWLTVEGTSVTRVGADGKSLWKKEGVQAGGVAIWSP